jgi:ketosteroid isomerase-like protein
MKPLAILVLTAFLAPAPQAPPKPDLTNPEAAIRSFFSAYNDLDLQRAVATLDAVKTGPALKELEQDMKANNQGSVKITAQKVRLEGTGDTRTAVVTVRIVLSHDGMDADSTGEDRVQVKRTGKEWKLVPPTRVVLGKAMEEGRAGQTRSLFIPVLGTVAFPEVFLAARKAARSAAP